MKTYDNILNRKFLEKNYIRNQYSLYQIGLLVNCSTGTVLKYLRKYNIKPRKKWIKPHHIKVCYYCKDCGKAVSTKKTKRCSSCYHKWQKITLKNKGKNHYNYKSGKSYCEICGKPIAYKAKRCRKHQEKHNVNCKCCFCKAKRGEYRNIKNPEHSKRMKGNNNPSWRGGISFEPYSFEWAEHLKKKIRKRDNYTCQVCGIKEEKYGFNLDIHHIDYNKKNCLDNNLICLCKSCHGKTNFLRKLWKYYLPFLLTKNFPTRTDVVKQLKISFSEKDIIISSLGMTSRTVEEIFKSDYHFPLVGGMGSATSVGIGIAKSTTKMVKLLLGDGEALMGLESFVMVNKLKLKNLKIFILDNGVHASTGGQETISKFVNFISLCPNIIHLKISPEKGDAPRISLPPIKIKKRFQNALKGGKNG